ncbi:protocadherin Fat 4-like [Corticium candelabrum]|uniref:protocadherin Fat 4-like n=1 Tax=Corticium candelabrum TaxID=121492 RepID=UPI002E2731DF|nr:protocadherin Fat 4-like [Corticium candelabrum]
MSMIGMFVLLLCCLSTALADNGVAHVREERGGITVLDLKGDFVDLADSYDFQFDAAPPEVTEYFTIDKANGIISTLTIIDREVLNFSATDAFEFKVQSSPGPKFKTVKIYVDDINDNAPSFPSVDPQNATVSERAAKGGIIASPSAYDPDIGNNTVQSYSGVITSGNEDGHFVLRQTKLGLHRLKMELEVVKPLDREKQQYYQFNITVSDNGNPRLSSWILFNLTVTDVNDNPPRFVTTSSSIDVPEDTKRNHVLVQLHATDLDEISRLVYSIISVTPQNYNRMTSLHMFAIDPGNGTIKLLKSLDYEYQLHRKLDITVQVFDGSYTDVAVVKLNVKDVNDNAPVFVKFIPSEQKVKEDLPLGGKIVTVLAIDKDSGSNKDLRYNITGDKGYFRIIPKSFGAEIVLLQNLDREHIDKFDLTVTMFDQGIPSLTASQSLNIVVTDVNDNSPTFVKSQYTKTVSEDVRVGSVITPVSATDPDDGSNGAVEYSIPKNQPQSNWFAVDSAGVVRTVQKLDRETASVVYLIVTAEDMGSPTLAANTTVIVTLTDVNDNSPLFSQQQYNISVPENASRGVIIAAVFASDPDEGTFGDVTYTVASGFVQSEFILNSTSGELTLNATLDREKDANYILVVDAVDGGMKKSFVNIVVTVIDINDHHPLFYPQYYHCVIYENTSVGHHCVSVSASDEDENKVMTYQIVNGNEDGDFKLDRQSGSLVTANALDYEQRKSYMLVVSATDAGGLMSNLDAVVNVTVANVLDKPPLFGNESYAFTVNETDNQGTVVGWVSAIIQDAGTKNGQLSYSITGGDPHSKFEIDSVSGKISLMKKVDREAVPFYQLQVEAHCCGVAPLYAIGDVNVTVLDTNDNAPKFRVSDMDILRVDEQLPIGYKVTTLDATDEDEGANADIYYHMTEKTSGLFSIGNSTGNLYLKQSLDYETLNQTSILVTAYDRGSPQRSSSVSLIIMVMDVNDNFPEFVTSMYETSVFENVSLAHTVLRVSSADLDSGSNSEISYSLDGNSKLPFEIVATGDIYVITQLDAETLDSYDFNVIAKDNGQPSLNATVPVHIDVLDVNDNSPVFDPYVNLTFLVVENVHLGYVVGQLVATDRDEGQNGMVAYSFATQVDTFQVDPSNGTITVASSIDRELRSSYTLTVTASDHGTIRHTTTTVIHIHILDLNDNAPVFDQLKSVFAVKENTPVNESFDVVQARDMDIGANGEVRYVIKSGNERGHLFIDYKVGSLIVAKSLDRETVNSYDLSIEAFDNGHPRKATVKQIKVEVVDVNDNRPVFLNSSGVRVRTREDVAVNTVLAQLVATDDDSGQNGVVLFSIEHGNVLSTFHIDSSSGALQNSRLLDYESRKTYNLIIKATDSATFNALDSSISVFIELIDVNDNRPVFSPSSFSKAVYEDIPLFASIVKVSATDDDHGTNGEIQYSISERIPASRQSMAFTIDSVSGIVRTQMPLPSGITSYDLIIVAEDQAQLLSERHNTTAILKIAVQQQSHCPTVFFTTSDQLTVSEDSPINQPLYVVAARDNNPTGCSVTSQKFSYSLDHGNERNTFELDYVTGELKLSKSLDREARDYYNLSIHAYGEGAPPPIVAQNLRVTVTDVNDNSPIFDSVTYTADVDEGAAEGTRILKVHADDYDSGSNGDVTYSILAGNQFGFFTVHNKTGWIQLASVLTPPQDQSLFRLTVRAEDRAQQPKWTTVEVVVSVHARLMPPSFRQPNYVFPVLENNPDHATIGIVQAFDTAHRQVNYEILGNTLSSLFTIGNSSGSITVTRALDYEIEQEFKFIVRASLAINSSLATTIDVKVQVQDANDNSPVFEFATYPKFLTEAAAVGLSVLRVKANDADSGLHGTLIYSLEGSDGSFIVNSSTGWISVATPLDREKTSTYVFQVRASESTSQSPQSTFCLVQITLQDINDNSPIFTQLSYQVNVSSNVLPHTKVLQIVALDADAGSNGAVTYKFDTDQTAFLLDQQTGLITISKIGLVAEHLYSFTVTAADGGSTPRITHQSVEVHAVDSLKQLPPRFLQSTMRLNIDENTAASFLLATIEAVSDRPATNMQYSFSSGNHGSKFNIRTSRTGGTVGLLTLTKSLDADTVDFYDLVVRADDNGSPALHSDMHVYVNVTPARGGIAEFINPRIGYVYENQPVNTSLMTITACNPFSTCKPNKFQYYLATDGDSTAFVIDQKTGELKTAKLLDAETKQSYDIVVTAVDLSMGSQSGTATIQITVLDQNDNEPHFLPPSNVSVVEGIKEGSVITTLSAMDADVSHRLSFALTAGTDNKFYVDATTGRVTVEYALDYETSNFYEVNVAVYDGVHTDRTKFYVTVLDSNDNLPQFSSLSYESSVFERSEPGTIVANVKATDRDSGSNGEIRYALRDSYNYLFRVNPQTGNVSCNMTVFYRYGSKDFYDLKVIAYDHGTPMLSSEATVTVRIIDLNDNAPHFVKSLFLVEVPENVHQGSTVGAVKAIDTDEGANGELNYQSVAGNGTKYFIVEAKTGSIVVVRQGFVLSEVYSLMVRAFDSGTYLGVQENTTQVKLIIVHKQPVTFEQKLYNVSLAEGLDPGSVVIKVVAYAGSPNFSIPLEYQISRGPNSSQFVIDQTSGKILTRATLDYFDSAQYQITVIASDTSSPASSATATVLVNIIDKNNHPPVFDKSIYTALILENSRNLAIRTVSAADKDSGLNSKIRFSLVESLDSMIFRIDAVTGNITARESLDYEKRQHYSFIVKAVDLGQPPLSSTTRVNVTVQGENEMIPEFEHNSYKFSIQAETPSGASVGQVRATDGDHGSDGKVYYEFKDEQAAAESAQVSIDVNTGVITFNGQTEKSFKNSRVRRATEHALFVVARDGGRPSLTGTAVVVVDVSGIEATKEPSSGNSSSPMIGIIIGAVIAVVALLIVGIVILLLRKRRTQRLDITNGGKSVSKKPPITLYASSNPSVSSHDKYRQSDQQHQHSHEMHVYGSNERSIDVGGVDKEMSKSNSSLLTSVRFQSQDRLLTASCSPQNSTNSSDADLSPEEKETVVLPSASESSAVSMLPKKAYSPSQSRTESEVRTNSDAGSVRSGTRQDMDPKQLQNIWRDLEKLGLNDGQESTYDFNIQGGGEADGGIDVSNLLNTRLAEADADEFDAFIDGTRAFSYEGASDTVTVSAGGSIASTGYAEDDFMSNPYAPHYQRPWLSEINRTRPPKQPPPGAAPVRPGASFPSQQGRAVQRHPMTNHHARKFGAPPLSGRNRLKGMKNNGLSPCISPGVSMSTSLATTPEATPSAGNLSPILSPTLSPSERTESRGSSPSMTPTHSSVSEVDAVDR